MGLGERDFAKGLQSVRELALKERAQRDAVMDWRMRFMQTKTEADEKAMGRAPAGPEQGPLWQRVSGISPKTELSLEPAERRAGIRRLLRVVETMVRVELKSEDVDRDGGPVRLAGGEASFSGRSGVWEPLHEICLYLGISKSKLDALSVQRTGLRAVDICDCIRAEGFRSKLRETFRPLVRAWIERLKKAGACVNFGDDPRNAAWRFVKWMRGGGHCSTRKKLAFEMGMASRERLDRAVLVGERETLEEVEIAEAMRALEEHGGEVSAHGAGCDEVVEGGVMGLESEDGKAGEMRLGGIDDLRVTIDD